MEQEIWKSISEYEGYYEVSNSGKVRSVDRLQKSGRCTFIKRGKEKKQTIGNHGYFAVVLYKRMVGTTFLVHRLIAKAFVPNPENKSQVNHKNGIRTDNSLGNIEWVTQQENIIHEAVVLNSGFAYRKGEKSYLSKLKNDDIVCIRKMRSAKLHTCQELADKYGVAHQTISKIANKKAWAHI